MKKSRSWRDVYSVHPAADVFPAMSPADLRTLAKDIQANGLQNKVLLWSAVDGDGVEQEYVLDGRSRLDAMELAHVEILDEHGKMQSYLYQAVADMSSMTAGALAVALNIKRRHLTPSQRADLAKDALKADKEFRKQLSTPSTSQIPTAQSCAVGIAKPDHDAKGKKTKGNTANRSVVADVAAAAAVHRNTARKRTRDLKAEQDLAQAQKHARIIEMLQEGTPHKQIAATLHVGEQTVSRLRKQIGLSKVDAKATSAPATSATIPLRKPKNEDKRMLGLLHELAEIPPENLSDPKSAGQQLMDHARRFIAAGKASAA